MHGVSKPSSTLEWRILEAEAKKSKSLNIHQDLDQAPKIKENVIQRFTKNGMPLTNSTERKGTSFEEAIAVKPVNGSTTLFIAHIHWDWCGE
jgi:hypothetical protein